MKNLKINLYLILTILTLSVSSFLISYTLLDEILDSAISLGINPKIGEQLNNYQEHLKKLRLLDPENKELYKTQFYAVQDTMTVFQDRELLTSLVKSSYKTYFVIIFLSVLLLSLSAAFFLSWRVSKSYKLLHASDLKNSQRLQELEYFDNWQHTAASLAHEIKNPLTPIELMVSNLTPSIDELSTHEFKDRLNATRQVILDEVGRLKSMVNHFNQFSKLPEPNLENRLLIEYLNEQLSSFSSSWSDLEIKLCGTTNAHSVYVKLDKYLFRQCLLNIFQNAVDATPTGEVTKISLKVDIQREDFLTLLISNKGKKLPQEVRRKLFQVGFTTKGTKENRGLGLSIVKKIILQHEGDIDTLNSDAGAVFSIQLPYSTVA